MELIIFVNDKRLEESSNQLDLWSVNLLGKKLPKKSQDEPAITAVNKAIKVKYLTREIVDNLIKAVEKKVKEGNTFYKFGQLSRIKTIQRIFFEMEKDFVSVAEFARENGFSESWGSVKRRIYPDAFIKINNNLYVNPKKIWHRDKEINRKYRYSEVKEFEDNIEDAYYQVLHYFKTAHGSAGVLTEILGRSKDSWSVFINKFKFPMSDMSNQFIEGARIIIAHAEEYLKQNDMEKFLYSYAVEAWDKNKEYEQLPMEDMLVMREHVLNKIKKEKK